MSRRYAGRMVMILMAALLVLPMAGCGKKSKLEKPPGAEYPKVYPSR